MAAAKRRVVMSFMCLTLALTACAAPLPPAPTSGGRNEPGTVADQPRRGGTITVPITSSVPALGIVGVSSTSTGGWGAASELYANGLITSDMHTRKAIGRLAERVPTLDDGSISVLPEGRMRVVYHLRKDVTWQDGVPFTAQDLVFSHQFNTDPGIPALPSEVTRQIESVEAPDDFTFVINFAGPYYRADQIGVRVLWPQPRHLLGPAYERFRATKNPDDVLNLPYWTSEFVHLGPFRLTSFDPSNLLVFQAYDGYFLGKPKVDTIQIRIFSDQNTLYSNLLAGTVDVLLDTTLEPELGFQLMEHWRNTDGGTVFLAKSAQRFLSPQMRSDVQTEPTVITDVRVRAALYYALDRETLTEGLQFGSRDLAAWELLWPGEPLHEATKDALRRYAYDPERARALLRDAGWRPGPNGMLQHETDGRPFKTSVTGTSGRIEREIGAYADYWKRIGVNAEPRVIPGAQVRNAEYRALYPGWEASASGGGDEILGRLEGPAASPQNRWNGNRGGYEDPRAQQLIDSYRASLSTDAQFRAMKAISDLIVAELPLLILFSTVEPAAVRKGIKALDDNDGAESASRPYGTRTRNAHLWEVE